MTSSVLIIAGSPFTHARVSPATLLPYLIREAGQTFIHLTLATSPLPAGPSTVNYWNLETITSPDGSLYVFFAGRDQRSERRLLQSYSWLRELLQNRADVRRVHSFGVAEADYLAAPLAAEFGLEWFRSAHTVAPADVAVSYHTVPLGDSDWTRGIWDLKEQIRQCEPCSIDDNLTVMLPPSGVLVKDDLNFAQTEKVVLLEPIALAETVDDAGIVTFAPRDERELLTIISMAGQLVVPRCGSWLAQTALSLAAARVRIA